MGRMNERDLTIIKTTLESGGGYMFSNDTIRSIVAHAEAIELELKASKENEVEAVRKFGEDELNIVRLTENVEQLHKELRKSREARKVALPKAASDEIQAIKQGCKGDWRYRVLKQLFERSDKTENLRRLGIEETLLALLNGYTVEKTKEERLQYGVHEVVMKWWNDPNDPIFYPLDLAAIITDFVTKFNAENE